MTTEDRIESIQEALQRRFRAAGHGSIRRVQEALNLGAGYFKDQRRPDRRRVDLRVLFSALDVLGIDPADFFAEALGTVDPVALFRSEAEALRRRFKPLPRILKLEYERDPGRGECRRADLSALDAAVAEDPRLVLRRSHALIKSLDDRQVPTLLGIYASACRLSGRLDPAHIVLGRGLELAARGGDFAVEGDLLRRAGALVAERGDPQRALALSEHATLAYVKVSDLIGIGKCLLDQGLWLAELGRHRRAARAFETALAEYLPAVVQESQTDVWDPRFACLLNLSLARFELGELDSAHRAARTARELSDGVAPGLRGRLEWLLASIARHQKRLGEAERHLQGSLDVYRPIDPLATALVSLELIYVQLLDDKTADAYETARTLTRLLEPLRRDTLASAGLAEILRPALAGRGLTLELVDRVAGRLRDERANRLAA